MSNPMPDLMSMAIEARNVVRRMITSFSVFPAPPTQDLEQTLSFEFFYQRKGAFGRRGIAESRFESRSDDRGSKNH
jgi:hypothetical protein